MDYQSTDELISFSDLVVSFAQNKNIFFKTAGYCLLFIVVKTIFYRR